MEQMEMLHITVSHITNYIVATATPDLHTRWRSLEMQNWMAIHRFTCSLNSCGLHTETIRRARWIMCRTNIYKNKLLKILIVRQVCFGNDDVEPCVAVVVTSSLYLCICNVEKNYIINYLEIELMLMPHASCVMPNGYHLPPKRDRSRRTTHYTWNVWVQTNATCCNRIVSKWFGAAGTHANAFYCHSTATRKLTHSSSMSAQHHSHSKMACLRVSTFCYFVKLANGFRSRFAFGIVHTEWKTKYGKQTELVQ